jgi:hypothetical protein
VKQIGFCELFSAIWTLEKLELGGKAANFPQKILGASAWGQVRR